MEELSFIDDTLEPLITMIKDKKKYLIIITSDHAGHDKIHGSDHPEDSRLPLVVISDIYNLTAYQDRPYKVSQLKTLLDTLPKGPLSMHLR
jgi:phosphopentomutase